MEIELDYKQLSEEFPDAVRRLKSLVRAVDTLIEIFDENGVRVYLGYGASGGHSVEVWRKKTEKEFKKDNPNKDLDLNWRMTRIGIIQSYNSREEAYKAGFKEAFNQLQYLIDNDSRTN
jgi:hypothetical protein